MFSILTIMFESHRMFYIYRTKVFKVYDGSLPKVFIRYKCHNR